ncbi:MAG TPA: hypothetical protein VGR28_03240 [Candidatus Thermoplasmatota archaeon]|jgi:hypothetical protein|nr:hypothetical protein [Candidatus Thermoplasmatota archaeon]
MGWFSPGTILLEDPALDQPLVTSLRSCTAHHGRLVPDPDGRDLLAMAFYTQGTVLVDFTNPRLPAEVAQFHDSTDTWEAQYYSGYLFTGDRDRGMDVLGFT